MFSTLAIGTPTPVASAVSSNALSPSSVSPTYTPSPSSRVNTVLLLTSSTSPTPSTSAPVTSASSEQPPSSVLQMTTATTTVATIATLSSASPSSPPETSSLTSSSFSSPSSSVSSATTSTSADGSRSTTPTATPVQTTTPSTTTVSRSNESPTSTLSSITTTTTDTTTSSYPISAPTSSILSTTSLPSDLSSPSPSPEKPAIPLTTVLESTTFFITETNSQGQVMTSAPRVVTEVITTTGVGGIVTTVTQAIVNPSLAPNNSTAVNSSFFTNTGAVVGVFVVVGLASASIMMWILFAIRHRQRMKRIEQDTAVEAAVAAAGFNRTPLDDDDEGDSPISPNTRTQFSSEMGQRSSIFGLGGSASLPPSTRLSVGIDDTTKYSANLPPGCSVEHNTSGRTRGYASARTASPSPRCIDDLGSSRDRKSSYGHTPTYSAGSFEPLLANYMQSTSDRDPSALAMQPPRNHSELVYNGSSDGSPEVRSRTSSKRRNSSDSSIIGDGEDYTRYVLTVRNIPDDQSQHSL